MIVGYTTSEWLKVKSLYRSDDLAELRYAVAILQVWRIRMGNSMHVAAEMSELILSAIIADKQSSLSTRDNDWLSTFNQRLLYSAALIRFVNYLNELCQRKEPTRAMSIKQAVSLMNVPSWIVEVRHQATHQHLPSLNILRTATNWCRDWLWSHHWQKPIDEIVLYNDNEEDLHQLITIYDQIELLINDFIRDRMNSLNDLQHSSSKKKSSVEHINKVLNQLERMIVSNLNEFIEIFIMDGYLIMTETQLNNAGFNPKQQQRGKQKQKPPKEPTSQPAACSRTWNVPVALQIFWKPILSILNGRKALPQLLFHLILASNSTSSSSSASFSATSIAKTTTTTTQPSVSPPPSTSSSLSNPNSIRQLQLIGWADRMLDAFVHSQQLNEFEWKFIVKAMLSARDNFSEKRLKESLSKIASINNRKRKNLEQLLSMSPKRVHRLCDDKTNGNANASEDESIKPKQIKTISDLNSLKESINSLICSTNQSNNITQNADDSCWIRCDAMRWRGVPLGLTPQQNTDTLILVIDSSFVPRKPIQC